MHFHCSPCKSLPNKNGTLHNLDKFHKIKQNNLTNLDLSSIHTITLEFYTNIGFATWSAVKNFYNCINIEKKSNYKVGFQNYMKMKHLEPQEILQNSSLITASKYPNNSRKKMTGFPYIRISPSMFTSKWGLYIGSQDPTP